MGFVLLSALWIDRFFGESPAVFHPVVWIGRFLQVCGRITVRCPPALAFSLGALAWWTGALATAALAWQLQCLTFRQLAGLVATPGLQHALAAMVEFVLMAWLLKSMLSWRMLRDEVNAVEAALKQSLPAGRERLSMLVSRETTLLG
ncbi:MAG: cobalamin biosynthesis protein, partial [Polaromonas sp.]